VGEGGYRNYPLHQPEVGSVDFAIAEHRRNQAAITRQHLFSPRRRVMAIATPAGDERVRSTPVGIHNSVRLEQQTLLVDELLQLNSIRAHCFCTTYAQVDTQLPLDQCHEVPHRQIPQLPVLVVGIASVLHATHLA
jgi:hypothetical protein